MPDDPWQTVVQLLTLLVTAYVAFTASRLAFRLDRGQRTDRWRTAFAEYHQAFWTDSDIRRIRCAVAYPNAYRDVGAVLARRRRIDQKIEGEPPLESHEYELLDQLDKFLNLLQRITTIAPSLPEYRQLWGDLFVAYWMTEMFRKGRPDLDWYLRTYYPTLRGIPAREGWAIPETPWPEPHRKSIEVAGNVVSAGSGGPTPG